MPKTYVIIPTYNEAENLEPLLRAILDLRIPDLTALVVDDNSPDGTGKIAQGFAERANNVKVLIRGHNRGRGTAGVDGFKLALKEGADYIIEMDADFSHHPKYIPDLLIKIKEADIVIGSRYIKGGRDADRSFIRRVTTFMARKYIQIMLGLKINDVTSGYRCFKRSVLENIALDKIISTGPSILEEILYQAKLKNYKIIETPIVFEDRKKGSTKLNLTTLLKTLYLMYKFKRIYK